jgi:hypothetical protein
MIQYDWKRQWFVTSFGQMVWLSVTHSSRPPWRLGRIRLKLLGPASNYFSPVVWVVDLLARLHELDVGLGYDSTVRLL